ncbi:MAG: hypothetical protein KGS72_19825 [Cyanobacteria bacterium REEB67]|nr:hypothetical protein [Cyanobacteria bacterium REEB67]
MAAGEKSTVQILYGNEGLQNAKSVCYTDYKATFTPTLQLASHGKNGAPRGFSRGAPNSAGARASALFSSYKLFTSDLKQALKAGLGNRGFFKNF